MQIKIVIDCDNAAFEDARHGIVSEAIRILRGLCDKLEPIAWDEAANEIGEINLLDINGNSVGKCEFVD